MEALTVEKWLDVQQWGRDPGSGCGSGSGRDCGCGRGSGSGSGYGSAYGYGIKSFCGERLYRVDETETIIRRIKGNVAKGAILHSDLTLEDCWIVKQDEKFAHGKTLCEAMEALRYKLFEDMPEDERIAAFVKEHEWGRKYSGRDLYDWHHRLTGSCEMGRSAFAADHGIDVDTVELTVEDFIRLTESAYGGAVIRKVGEAYAACGCEIAGKEKT